MKGPAFKVIHPKRAKMDLHFILITMLSPDGGEQTGLLQDQENIKHHWGESLPLAASTTNAINIQPYVGCLHEVEAQLQRNADNAGHDCAYKVKLVHTDNYSQDQARAALRKLN